MADRNLLDIATTPKIGSHPMHPMLIPFPIALLIATFVCDLAYWQTARPFWAEAAFWSLVAAIVMAALAAIAGFTDFLGNAAVRNLRDAWYHMIGNVAAVVLTLINLWMRYQYGPEQGARGWGLVPFHYRLILLVYTGWKGGDLVYRHRIGMHPEAPAETGASASGSRSTGVHTS